MTDAEFDNYVKTRYEDQVAWYGERAGQNKRRYIICQTAIIVLPLAAAVLALIGESWERWAIVTLTTLATAASMIMVAFKFADLWFNYRTVCEMLKKEIHYYTAGLGEYQYGADPRRLFVQRVESLISREHSIMPPASFQQLKAGQEQSPPTGA
ncbi:MAG: DUF4231 domain-containing protein [candidate division Zixibacteria bacterium]|nr:DUF4231 domain-containing protein [candidate division Zixibacteria bacterium]